MMVVKLLRQWESVSSNLASKAAPLVPSWTGA